MRLFALVSMYAALLPLVGCGDPMELGGDGGSGMDATSGRDGTVPGRDGETPTEDGTVTLPDGTVIGDTQCSNGTDDDADGDIDGMDQECSSPLDDDESSFGTGIPGDNRDPDCQDCFFDGNSGSGDDGCRYATSCLTTGTPESGAGSCMTCDTDMACEEGCLPATPNGCDCFGCCEVDLGGGESVNILLGGSCSLENIDDTTECPRCMPDSDCYNDCGECELCLGRTIEDLPPSCTPDGGMPGYTCDDGEPVCGADGSCPEGLYCQLGCCLPLLI